MLDDSRGGVQFVELFSGSSRTVTLPQSFDTYKVLFVSIKSASALTDSCVCVPPGNRAFIYDGNSLREVRFSGKQVTAPYDFTIERIYAIA